MNNHYDSLSRNRTVLQRFVWINDFNNLTVAKPCPQNTCMKYGYARVWASDQDASLQRDALKLFTEADLGAAQRKLTTSAMPPQHIKMLRYANG
jgi:hypothetical protein